MPEYSDYEACAGCGAVLPCVDGPTHRYMASSPACFALFNQILAHEYSDPALQETHRLTVDTYAIQHPGDGRSRQQIQSVGLHLARLSLQIEALRPPKEANDVMLGLGRHKSSLEYLDPPSPFSVTVADVAPFAGGPEHAGKVSEWAAATWEDWSEHHRYVKEWVRRCGSG